MTTTSDASAAQPCATTTGIPLAPARLRASSAAYATSAATTATAPAASSVVAPAPIPSAVIATPGVYSHQIAAGQRSLPTGSLVATGSSCRLAPMAVIASTPSVTEMQGGERPAEAARKVAPPRRRR